MSQTVLVTGASSGIGEALALSYAKEGATLGLIGRDQARLQAVAERCRRAGAREVQIGAIDVRAHKELSAWVSDFDRRFPIGVTIVSAGIAGGAALAGDFEAESASREIFEINVLGVVNTVHAVLPGMLQRGFGQIAVISSLAGLVRLPDLPSYSASKAAILNYGLSLRDALNHRGVRVSVVCPGYVDTAMGRQLHGYKAFVVAPDKAARAIRRGLARNRRLVAFPFLLAAATRLSAFLPAWMIRRVTPAFRVSRRELDGHP